MQWWALRSRGLRGRPRAAKYPGEATAASLQLLGRAHGDHVLLNEFFELDAGIEPTPDWIFTRPVQVDTSSTTSG